MEKVSFTILNSMLNKIFEETCKLNSQNKFISLIDKMPKKISKYYSDFNRFLSLRFVQENPSQHITDLLLRAVIIHLDNENYNFATACFDMFCKILLEEKGRRHSIDHKVFVRLNDLENYKFRVIFENAKAEGLMSVHFDLLDEKAEYFGKKYLEILKKYLKLERKY